MNCTVHCLLWLQNVRQSVNPNTGGSDDEDDEDEGEGYHSELQTILESMTRRMIKCELEDFELVCIDNSSSTRIVIHRVSLCNFYSIYLTDHFTPRVFSVYTLWDSKYFYGV